MKFTRVKRDSLSKPGSTEVHYTEEGSGWKIVATNEGVVLQGNSPCLKSPGDFEIFAKTVGAAGKDHAQLIRALREKLAN